MKERYESGGFQLAVIEPRPPLNKAKRGGSVVISFDNALMQDAPPTENGPISEDELWQSLEYFLRSASGRGEVECQTRHASG